MPPKRRTLAAPPAGKHTRSSNATAINNACSTPDIVVSTASMDQLLSLSTRELRGLQLQAYSLLSSGNKAALADRLYHYFHTLSQVPNNSLIVSRRRHHHCNVRQQRQTPRIRIVVFLTHNSLHTNCRTFFVSLRQLHCKVVLCRPACPPRQ